MTKNKSCANVEGMSYKFEPLQRGEMPPVTEDKIVELAERCNIPLEAARKAMADIQSEEVWMNSTYQVNVRRTPEWTHLSIKRIDKAPCTDWRDKQEIKNQLVGAECEGLELYPAESRLVDGSNQYHVWVRTNPEDRIPVGWNEGRVVADTPLSGGAQRR